MSERERHRRIRSTFDDWARRGRDVGMEEGHGDAVRQALTAMEIRPGERILDLGCGNGWATRLLAAASGEDGGAVGLDLSEAMLRRALELPRDMAGADAGSARDVATSYVRSVMETLPFVDGAFDRVFSMEALYYSPDLDAAVSEIRRALRDGGAAEIVVNRFAEAAPTEAWSEQVGLEMHFLSEDEWAGRIREAGFDAVETRRIHDSAGPGTREEFEPSRHVPDWETHLEMYEAGSLWIRARL